jgi:GAF domain-containing protein
LPLAVPIKVRGEVVGVLDTYKPAEEGDWTAEELALIQEVVEQLDVALESARLHQDAQRRATREETIRRVTEEMRRPRDVDSILRATLAELTKALGVPRAYVRLGTEAELWAARKKDDYETKDARSGDLLVDEEAAGEQGAGEVESSHAVSQGTAQ